jgi:GH43 family beta-xylosidase
MAAEFEILSPYQESEVFIICSGSDPYVFYENDQWHLLSACDENAMHYGYNGINRYTIRSASKFEDLMKSEASPLQVGFQNENLRKSWAAEIHFGKYLYVSTSNMRKKNHRIRVYETEGGVTGPWKDLGLMRIPHEDNYWAIDITFARIPFQGRQKLYAIWSGWEKSEREFPQNLYIAEVHSPFEIGSRHCIASPLEDWCTSVKPILEGSQSLILEDQFRGLLVTGNASWTKQYETRVLEFNGGNPLDKSSWDMSSQPLFYPGFGIGHGMIIKDNGDYYYVGHKIQKQQYGWKGRHIFYIKLNKNAFLSRFYLNEKPDYRMVEHGVSSINPLVSAL